MSYVELIPIVAALSRSDEFRLIQILAEDLAAFEDSPSKPAEEISSEQGEDGIAEDDRVREAVHAIGMRNAIGRAGDDGLDHPPGNGVADSDRVGATSDQASQSYPYWSPDREAEASAILMQMLEAEKSKP